MDNFRTFEEIDVQLVSHIGTPYETSVASARTCYSGRGVVFPADVSKDEKAVELRDRIASSTLLAGHLTTRQHAHFVFAITGLSRQCIWSFLHGHPYYNSEQVSQRYVRVKRGNYILPPLSEAQTAVYAKCADVQMAAYERLIEVLRIPLASDYYERFKARRANPDKFKGSIDKRAFEVARYALGVGTTAYLYHTVSALTLLRYAKLIHLFETPEEQKILVNKMLNAVLAIDPLFEKELQDPTPLESTAEYAYLTQRPAARTVSADFIREFDTSLEGRVSKLVDFSQGSEELLADSVRVQLGRTRAELPTPEALAMVLDPAQNPMLADTLNVATLDRMSQVFHHVKFTFKKKISHTADSQDQRHRTVVSSRPVLMSHYTGQPDYVVPFGVTQSQEATDLYAQTMEESFRAINQLLDMGTSPEKAFYLLPNSFPIRMVSTGGLQALQHKWKLRSCYNAQEEIFRATIDEIQQVQDVFPNLVQHLKAPCYVRMRAGMKPFCPEGDRFCGLPVWKYDIKDYNRKSL